MTLKRLVIATPLYPPEIGGPATDAAGLVAHLSKRGTVSTVCPFSSCRWLPRGIRHFAYAYRLLRGAYGADGIIAFDTFSVGLPAVLVAWLLRVPLIVRVPGDYAWEQGRQRFGVTDTLEVFQYQRYGFWVELLRKCQRLVVRRAELVVVPSDFFKGIVSSWEVDSQRLVRIYLGLDLLEESKSPTVVPGGKIVFSVGRLVPWKGFSMLIALMPLLPEWHLVIAGDGPLRVSLQEEAHTSGVADRITFTGPLTHEEVLGWLARADAFALNTSFESFSFQVLEAMLSEIPVITTTAGSLPELVLNEEEGILCAPDDAVAFRNAIASVAVDSEKWQARVAAAKRKASFFSKEASLNAFVEAIQKICD